MDDRFFRQELHTLKQQVSQLSPTYAPKYRAHAHQMTSTAHDVRLTDDLYKTQLHDLNVQMNSMEESLNDMKHRLQQTRSEHVPLPGSSGMDNITEQHNFSLPSGPLFWQLFNSLRADLRTIDGRVAALEQSVSDLEDRVDGLEPSRFTPGSSTVGSEVGYNLPNQPMNAAVTNANFQSCMLPELCKEADAFQRPLPTSAEQFYRTHMAEPPQVYKNMLYPCQELPSYVSEYDQSRAQYEANLRSDTVVAGSAISRLHERNDAMQSHIDKVDRDNDALLRAIRTLTQRVERLPRHADRADAELPSGPWPKPYEKPEVRYRDREIARMDELLRISQDRLRSTEESIAQKDASISQLRAERDEQRARDSAERSYQMNDQFNRYLYALSNKDAEIAELRDLLGQRDEALQRWQESWNEVSDSYHHADEQVTAYKHAYYDAMVRADDDIQKLTSDHDKEMMKLKEFAEQKDFVIQRQEEVIARGGKLLEEKDAEIDAVCRQLRLAEDECHHARQEQGKLNESIRNKDEEIDELRREVEDNDYAVGLELNKPLNEKNNVTWDDPLPVPESHSRTPFPLPEQVVDGERVASEKRGSKHTPSSQERHPWVQTGESALQFERMPSTERRAYRWNGNMREQDVDVPAKKKGKRHRRYSLRSYPELERQHPYSPREENWIPPHAETRERPGPAPSEQGPVLDDISNYWPPLPAPVTARRMASDANLHSHTYDDWGGRSKLSKHKSMQELPKRRLHAYVESDAEAETGGEARR